jgi:hypothetical protein
MSLYKSLVERGEALIKARRKASDKQLSLFGGGSPPKEKPKAAAPQKAAGPFIGPKGGKWADPKHTIPYKEGGGKKKAAVPAAAKEHSKAAALHRDKASTLAKHAKAEKNHGKLMDLTEGITAHHNAANAHDTAATAHRQGWGDAEKLSAKAHESSKKAPMRDWHSTGNQPDDEQGWADSLGRLHSHPTAHSIIPDKPEPKADPKLVREHERRANEHHKTAEHHKKEAERLRSHPGVKDGFGMTSEDHHAAYVAHHKATTTHDRAAADLSHSERAKEESAKANRVSEGMIGSWAKKAADEHQKKAAEHRQAALMGGTEKYQHAHMAAAQAHKDAARGAAEHIIGGSAKRATWALDASRKAKTLSAETEMDLETPHASHVQASRKHYAQASEHFDKMEAARRKAGKSRSGTPKRKKAEAEVAAHEQAWQAHGAAARQHDDAARTHATAVKSPGYGGDLHDMSRRAEEQSKKAHQTSAYVNEYNRPVPTLPSRDDHEPAGQVDYHKKHAEYHKHRAEAADDPDKQKAHKKAARAHSAAAREHKRGEHGSYQIKRAAAHNATDEAEWISKSQKDDDMSKAGEGSRSFDHVVEGLPFSISEGPMDDMHKSEAYTHGQTSFGAGELLDEMADIRQMGANGGMPDEDLKKLRERIYSEPETCVTDAIRDSNNPYGNSY